jgi:isoleucyl-tRNA synthetase
MEDVILDEINVKRIEFVHDESDLVIKKAKPNFRSLGQKFGKQVQGVASRIRELTSGEISRVQREGTLGLTIGESEYRITKEDIEVLHEDLHGWLVETDGAITVALDTTITPELLNEGIAREFVNRIQNLRKDSGFEVTDRIRISIAAEDAAAKALSVLREYIMRETLAVDLAELRDQTAGIEEVINGYRCRIVIEKTV